MLHLSTIWTYPLKSAAKISSQGIQALPRGLAGDRRWMLVNQAGKFLSQRNLPKMALIQVTHQLNHLIFRAPAMQDLICPINPKSAPTQAVQIWRDRVSAHGVSNQADQWFSDYLGISCKLVHMQESDCRLVATCPGVADGTQVSFADGFPLLLIGEGSLIDLNDRLEKPVTMAHFRPNLVIAGTAPFEEDEWVQIAIGNAVFNVVKPCARCVMTNIDPITGTRASEDEPRRTLASYRKVAKDVLFGQNLVVHNQGFVEVGQEVRILSRRSKNQQLVFNREKS